MVMSVLSSARTKRVPERLLLLFDPGQFGAHGAAHFHGIRIALVS